MLICPLCRQDFNTIDRKAMMSCTCGHSICSSCRDSLFSFKCPVSRRGECGEAEGFIVPLRHLAIADIAACWEEHQEEHRRRHKELDEATEKKKGNERIFEETESKCESLERKVAEMKARQEERRKAIDERTGKCKTCQVMVKPEGLRNCPVCSKTAGDKGKNLCSACFLDDHFDHIPEIPLIEIDIEDENCVVLDDSLEIIEEADYSILFVEKPHSKFDDDICIVDCVSAEKARAMKEKDKSIVLLEDPPKDEDCGVIDCSLDKKALLEEEAREKKRGEKRNLGEGSRVDKRKRQNPARRVNRQERFSPFE